MQFSLDLTTILNGLVTLVLGFAGWQFRRLTVAVEALKIDVAVIKSQVVSALLIGDDVKEHGKELIRIDEKLKKTKTDVDVLHNAKRDLYSKLSQH